MRPYFVTREPALEGCHLVHTDGCDHLPDLADCYPLGNHGSCFTALDAARRRFKTVNGCPDCCFACHRAPLPDQPQPPARA
ncbi:MAG: hypothetical protein ACLFV3_11560 [Phycisphaeraceae bacterium]